MDIDVVKSALGCYYGLVWAVFIQSPQAAYVAFVLVMSLPAQASVDSSSLGSMQHLFQTLRNVIVMWSFTLSRKRPGQTNLSTWPLLLLRIVSCQGWIFSICIGTQNGNLILGLNFLICPLEMILMILSNSYRYILVLIFIDSLDFWILLPFYLDCHIFSIPCFISDVIIVNWDMSFFFSLVYILQFGPSRISLQFLLLFHLLKFVKLYSKFHCSIYSVQTIEKKTIETINSLYI